MAANIRITILGAGSAQFSAGIVRDLCVNPGLRGSHVVLMDIDEGRLNMIRILAERLNTELKAGLSFTLTTSRELALKNADFIINTALVGGHKRSEALRSLAERHGYYRGVGLHSITQMAFFLEVARDIERICPQAWLLQSANPVFEGCTLMTRETGVKVIGLCHGHYGYREIADVLGLEKEHVTAQMPGFNHWIWMTDFRYKGKDAYPLIDGWIASKAEEYWQKGPAGYYDNQMSKAAIQLYKMFGLMPIGDTPRFAGWWHNTDLEAKKKWFGCLGGFDSETGWSEYLADMDSNISRIESAATDYSRPVTDTFEARQSDEQIVPIINAIVNNQPGIYQVNIPNKGNTIKGFPEDLVVECQAVVDSSGVRPIDVPELPKKLMAGIMIPRWHSAECLVEALRRRDRDLLLTYILSDHRTKNLDQAEGLVDDWFKIGIPW